MVEGKSSGVVDAESKDAMDPQGLGSGVMNAGITGQPASIAGSNVLSSAEESVALHGFPLPDQPPPTPASIKYYAVGGTLAPGHSSIFQRRSLFLLDGNRSLIFFLLCADKQVKVLADANDLDSMRKAIIQVADACKNRGYNGNIGQPESELALPPVLDFRRAVPESVDGYVPLEESARITGCRCPFDADHVDSHHKSSGRKDSKPSMASAASSNQKHINSDTNAQQYQQQPQTNVTIASSCQPRTSQFVFFEGVSESGDYLVYHEGELLEMTTYAKIMGLI